MRIHPRHEKERGAATVEYVIALAFILIGLLATMRAIEQKAREDSGTSNEQLMGPCGGMLTEGECS